jgi:BTG family protein
VTGPRPEAIAAAAWWASWLNGPPAHDVGRRTLGERDSSDRATLAAVIVHRTFTAAQVARFAAELAAGIETRLAEQEARSPGSWRPDNPAWGSALRCVSIDYHPWALFRDAADRAGFRLPGLALPMKSATWINPGQVRAAAGYGAERVTIWPFRTCQCSRCTAARAAEAAAAQ